MAKTVYDLIKKQNGEHFAKAIRNYDNGIFDVPNIVDIVKYAGRDAEPIMSFLISLKNVRIEEQAVHLNPIHLLEMAGYKAYVADTLKKQNAIKGYFRAGETLCTFCDPNRFKDYYIINAVKKECLGDDKLPESQWHIKPAGKPEREDEYGTSVISIQVLKTGGFISIKNRYNHTVVNPDNTLNSNPDNIIRGLSDAIKHYFNVDFGAQKVLVPNGYMILNNQIIHYNAELFGYYYANDFYVTNGIIKEINKQSQLMLPGGLLFDLQKKEIEKIGNTLLGEADWAFILNGLIKNKKIQVKNTADGKKEVVADGRIVFSINPSNGLFNYLDLFENKVSYLILKRLDRYFDKDGVFDFTGVTTDLYLAHFNARNAVFKFYPKLLSLELHEIFGLRTKVLDFSGVEGLIIQNSDLSGVDVIKFNPKAKTIHLENCEGIFDKKQSYDFSGVTDRLRLEKVNISGCDIKFNPSTKIVELKRITLHGEYDFRNAERVDVYGSDLRDVTKIIVNKNTELIIEPEYTKKVRFVDEKTAEKNINPNVLKDATKKLRAISNKQTPLSKDDKNNGR